jgi:M6 family metalloprotease-like protein
MKALKNYLLIILTLATITIFNAEVEAAYLENVPVTLTQPDGTVLHCYATGDEFYSRLHDQNNFTIIQDHSTGFYVYAIESNGELSPTSYIACKSDPEKAGLTAGANITPEKMLQLRQDFWKNTPERPVISQPGGPLNAPQQGSNIGTINNIVVYIRFDGETEFTDSIVKYDRMFNGISGTNSMKNYFEEVSLNNLHIISSYFPVTNGSIVISVRDIYKRNYYQKYDSATNPDGYKNDRTAREHALLKRAVDSIANQVPGTLNIDYNGDGYVDNVCFIISGAQDGWSELLWPHRWSLFSVTANINGKRVWDYNFQLRDFLQGSGTGVLAHEMFHTLGAPDLYHYTSNGISPVGGWDVMESTKNPPEHMLTYLKFRYGKWISSIPEITSSGTYTLNPTTAAINTCYKIYSPYTSNEYFIVEYRRKTGLFESSVPGSGLIVYRINSLRDGKGNASGPPDEVYVYRPDGTDTINGSPNSAHFSLGTGRTQFNNTTNPRCFLTDNSYGGLDISNITTAGSTISFTVNILGFKPGTNFEASTHNTCKGKKVTLTDLSASFPNKWTWNITPYTFNYIDGTDSTSKNPVVVFNSDDLYTVTLKASNVYGDSTLSKQDYITVGTGVAIPFTEDFESGQFETNTWTLQNPDSLVTWAITDKASYPFTTDYSVFLYGFDYQQKKAKDDLISRNISLNGINYAKLRFDVSYRRFDNSSKDSLLVYVSTDCGNTFDTAVYIKSAESLATGPNKNSNYIPATDSDWRRDSIDISQYTGKNVVIRFQSVNDYGNNMYLDNIDVSGDSLTDFSPQVDNTVICKDEIIHFSDQSTGDFTSALWSFPGGNPATSSAQNPDVVYAMPGTYKVNLTKSIEGYIKTKTIEITVNDVPAVPVISQNGNTLSCSQADSYQWCDSSGKAITGETAQTFTPSKSGKYFVSVKNASGCTASSAIYDYNTGINDLANRISMSVYPNPNNGTFTISISGIVSSPVSLFIQNSLGQIAYSTNDLYIMDRFSKQISIDKPAQGMYFLILKNKDGQTAYKFFVE